MDFSKEIIDLVSGQTGGIVITDEVVGEIVYADHFFTEQTGKSPVGENAEETLMYLQDCPELVPDAPAQEWEALDIMNKQYYKINSRMFTKEGKLYRIHQLTNITEYIGLNRDIAKYMSFFKVLSGFQTAILENLSNSYQELLPILTDYFKTERAYFLIQRDAYIEIVSYAGKGKVYANDRIPMSQDAALAFLKENGEENVLLCSGDVSGQWYAIYLEVCSKMDRASMGEKTLVSVVRLYAENALMREKLIYDNEHDHLTGLYNKGKYLERIAEEYPYKQSIAIFNFDVNNLKTMNDKYGHEAGDKLIIKAADSIRKVTSNNVHGYRMGGDEFLMVACDVTEEEAYTLRTRWENELARLNTLTDGINCVIAVGMTYGQGDYDLSKLLAKADELMYEDKKAKKKPGEEIR